MPINIKQVLFSLFIAFVLIPGAVYVANAQVATDPTPAELHTLITTLTGRVDTLQTNLANATSTIASLTSRIQTLELKVSTLEGKVTDLQQHNTWTATTSTTTSTATSETTDNGTGNIVLCHKGKNTLRVGIAALHAHIAHGDKVGACAAY